MKHFLTLVMILLWSLGFAQVKEPKEMAVFAVKNADRSYTLIRMSMTDKKPIIYKLTADQKETFVKTYDNIATFENEYAFLNAVSHSKNEELLTAFYKDRELFEITGQKRSLDDYNAQTIKVYKIENNERIQMATYDELGFFYHSPYSGYLFIQ